MDFTLPNVWGQGQLFAFSALDGISHYSDDFVGILSGDRLGIRFFSKKPRELALVGYYPRKPVVQAVTGDLITVELPNVGTLHVIYADTHLIIGNICDCAEIVISVEGSYKALQEGSVEIQDTLDGQFTALMQENGKFAFGFAHSYEEAVALVKRGITLDVDAERQKKLAFYHNAHLPVAPEYLRLARKLLSVMKTQLYSPEGIFTDLWSTPDRLPHRKLWLWDSVFHAVGFRNIDPALAETLILSMLRTQQDNGFIPHMSSHTESSDITQPPVIAWGAWKVYEKSKNKAFLQTVFACCQKFLHWCRDNRRESEAELYTWLTGQNVHCRCDESGMDNSPRFDTQGRLFAIDFSCFMANETRVMTRIARELGDETQAVYYESWFQRIKNDINRTLWCNQEHFYYDYHIDENRLHKVESVASFLPLFAGVCDPAQAAALMNALNDPERFGCEFPVPSISKKDPTFGTDMWRGPVWLNYNYMIAEGLLAYGYRDKAAAITEKTVEVVDTWYQRTGTVFEFYDSENKKAPSQLNRKGLPYEPYNFQVRIQAIRDYGWSNTLTLDMLCNPIR